MLAARKAHLAGAALFVLVLCVLQSFSAALEYERQQILAGQIWRLWTGNFVHSHHTHLLLNALAAVALYYIFLGRVKLIEILRYGFVFPCLISLVLLFFYPDLAWYNGLSGVLHAFLSWVCLRFYYLHSRWYGFGLIAVWIKVLVEIWSAQAGHHAEIEGMTVIVEAHFIGVVLGTLAAVLSLRVDRITRTSC